MEKELNKKILVTTKKSSKIEKEKSTKSKLNFFRYKKNKNESVSKSLMKIDEKTKIETDKTSDDVKLYLKNGPDSQRNIGIHLH